MYQQASPFGDKRRCLLKLIDNYGLTSYVTVFDENPELYTSRITNYYYYDINASSKTFEIDETDTDIRYYYDTGDGKHIYITPMTI